MSDRLAEIEARRRAGVWPPGGIVADIDEMAVMVRERDAQIARLRAILSETAAAIGNGSAASPECSLDFLAGIPAEVRGEIARLRAELKGHR